MANSYKKSDIFKYISAEEKRQNETLQMIPSENHVSKAVMLAVGSVLMNKYSEGQPTKRYYQGNDVIDKIELTACNNALKLFDLDKNEWAVNVQAANGSVANLAVYTALLKPKDRMLSMYLFDGGHLSHGWQMSDDRKVSFTSTIYEPHYYHVDEKTQIFKYDEIDKIAKNVRPNIIISGGTAYPREIEHDKMGQIARKVGAFYLADVSHEAGLIAGGVNKSPFKHADVVTMTTRKTLRGPIGALIFSKKQFSAQINKALFPGLQGGPLNHSIAGIAVALEEALEPTFKTYVRQILKNSQKLASELKKYGFKLISGGTDKHLILLDMRPKGLDGWEMAWALEFAGIITNRNTIPNDTGSPVYPSGLRLGTPAITTRGMKEDEMVVIATWINETAAVAQLLKQQAANLDGENLRQTYKNLAENNTALKQIRIQVKKMCRKFPTPQMQ